MTLSNRDAGCHPCYSHAAARRSRRIYGDGPTRWMLHRLRHLPAGAGSCDAASTLCTATAWGCLMPHGGARASTMPRPVGRPAWPLAAGLRPRPPRPPGTGSAPAAPPDPAPLRLRGADRGHAVQQLPVEVRGTRRDPARQSEAPRGPAPPRLAAGRRRIPASASIPPRRTGRDAPRGRGGDEREGHGPAYRCHTAGRSSFLDFAAAQRHTASAHLDAPPCRLRCSQPRSHPVSCAGSWSCRSRLTLPSRQALDGTQAMARPHPESLPCHPSTTSAWPRPCSAR